LTAGVNPGDGRASIIWSLFQTTAAFWKSDTCRRVDVHIASALRRFVDQGSLCTADISDVNGPKGAWRSFGMRQSPSAIMSDLGLAPVVTFVIEPAAAVLELSGQRFRHDFPGGDHSKSACLSRDLRGVAGCLIRTPASAPRLYPDGMRWCRTER